MNIINAYLILAIRLQFEIVKRIIFITFYPFAYWLRKWARELYDLELIAFCLWLMLDDSINKEGIISYGKDIEYCAYGKRFGPIEKLPEGWFKEFLRAWHWSAWRNNGINLSREYAAGNKTAVLKKSGPLEIREFTIDHGACVEISILPYFELPLGKFRIQCGWISNGRFEAEFRKVK